MQEKRLKIGSKNVSFETGKNASGMIQTMFDIPSFLSGRFYRNCRRQRSNGAKICGDCPFKEGIEQMEFETDRTSNKSRR